MAVPFRSSVTAGLAVAGAGLWLAPMHGPATPPNASAVRLTAVKSALPAPLSPPNDSWVGPFCYLSGASEVEADVARRRPSWRPRCWGRLRRRRASECRVVNRQRLSGRTGSGRR